MRPDINLSPFGLDIAFKAYALFTVLGALTAAALALMLLKRAGIPVRRSAVLLALMTACFLVGARLLNAGVNPDAYGGSFRLWTLRLQGLSLYGGIAGAAAALFIWLRRYHYAAWPALDALTMPFGAAFALARVGCYLNGCCGGIQTDSACGVFFPTDDGSSILPDFPGLIGSPPSAAVYPTQLFELALALLGLIPAMWLYFRGKSPPGTAFLVYGVWFSAMRLAVLPLRSLPYPPVVTALVYPLLYAGTIVAGIALLIYIHKKAKKSPPSHRTAGKTDE
jgi:phosphatidylglycerol:prolipoprotein diacylglycerol transferase